MLTLLIVLALLIVGWARLILCLLVPTLVPILVPVRAATTADADSADCRDWPQDTAHMDDRGGMRWRDWRGPAGSARGFGDRQRRGGLFPISNRGQKCP